MWATRAILFYGGIGLLCVVFMSGCAAKPRLDVLGAVSRGHFSPARLAINQEIVKRGKPTAGGSGKKLKSVDRTYILNRARLLSLMLGEGYARHADPVVEELYALLRTQGLNKDKTVASVLLNEDIKTWKGEPFEQAMMLCWIGMHYGMQGDWGNTRAAAENSLFHLRDFGKDAKGKKYDAISLSRDMLSEDVDETGYATVESNFALSYLLSGIANQQLGRVAESEEMYRKYCRYNSNLTSVVEGLKQENYNTIFVVEYGNGPQKIGAGPNQAVAMFVPITRSDQAHLSVHSARGRETFPVAMDLNTIATDLMWNNLEDIRLAKSYLGSALLLAGVITADHGVSRHSSDTAIAGLILMGAGAYLQSQAHADTRYCEAMPQRVYLATAMIAGPKDQVMLQIEGKPGSQLVVSGMPATMSGEVRLQYVRLPSAYVGAAPAWAQSGQTFYANVYEPNAGVMPLPYIMGGDCVLPPTYDALARYQNAGYLQGYTLDDLIGLYRAEGIVVEAELGAMPGLHVLDGGNSLVAPAPGTTGYARLFGQRHEPYRPKSRALSRAIAKLESIGQNQVMKD